MNHYSYQATNAAGDRQTGTVSAASLAEAVHDVEQRGLTLETIGLISVEQFLQDRRLSDFERLVAELMNARSQWLPALDALAAELPAAGVRRELQRVLRALRRDMSPSQFLANPDTAACLPLLVNGLQSDSGSARLHDWIASIARELELRAQRRRMVIYPALLLVLALAILSVFAAYLIPIFKSMFTEFGLSLPAPTLLAIWISDQVVLHYGRLILSVAAVAVAAYGTLRYWRSRGLTNRLLGILVAGNSGNLAAMSAFTSTLAELLSLQAPLPEALRLAGASSRHAYFRQTANKLADQVDSGASFPSQTAAARRLPPLVIHALQLGPGGIPSVALLRELAQVYGERARFRMDWITAGLPPLAMLLVGIVVGFVVISLFMPLVSMVSSLA